MIDRMKKISDRIYKRKSVSENKNKKPITTQNFVKKMRSLNEEEQTRVNRKTIYDQTREERNFRNNFNDLNVIIEFIPLEVYDDFVFWGGTIDGAIQFAYKVTSDEETSGIEFKYLEDFSPDNEDNKEVIERIENYYDQFYRYWRNNVIQI